MTEQQKTDLLKKHTHGSYIDVTSIIEVLRNTEGAPTIEEYFEEMI